MIAKNPTGIPVGNSGSYFVLVLVLVLVLGSPE